MGSSRGRSLFRECSESTDCLETYQNTKDLLPVPALLVSRGLWVKLRNVLGPMTYRDSEAGVQESGAKIEEDIEVQPEGKVARLR
jgi:hypothetical protein